MSRIGNSSSSSDTFQTNKTVRKLYEQKLLKKKELDRELLLKFYAKIDKSESSQINIVI